MPVFKVPLEDIRFVMNDLLNVGSLAELPGYEEATPDMYDAILEEGAKLCEEVLFPLNHTGDEEGCHFENGVVRTPKGFKEAYKLFAEAGWTGLSADPEYGGQGLPQVLNFALQEQVTAANMSFGMYPGLSHGAYNALHMHGSDELKQKYLPKLIDGTWSGTMCLTEPHCGTDLGLIRTKAVPADNDTYKITGQKIFISAGEHDMTENILHLVLAKLPDAPEGTRGISLFLVPKYLPREEGGNLVPGPSNGVSCGSIEVKMGIKASATCVMNFDEATGWLVGEPHKGMRAMFTMMNEARLGVGIQGLAIGEVSFQNAVAYANDRIQGRALDGAKEPEKAADPIIVHPDVRKNLMTMKAFTEGARALAYWVAMENDKYIKHPDAKTRQKADDLVALLTPIIKAYLTDMGYESANMAVQVYGGAGYIKEHGVEQYIRDARITQIYEGTNGIQALDLVGRKMGQHMGRLLRRFFHPVQAYIEENQSNADLQEFVFGLAKPFAKLQQATALIAQKGLKDPNEAGAVASDYLRLFALVAMGYMWLRMAKVAQEKLAEGTNGRDEFYTAKIQTARFFFQKMLPEADARFKCILAGKDTIMDIPAQAI